ALVKLNNFILIRTSHICNEIFKNAQAISMMPYVGLMKHGVALPKRLYEIVGRKRVYSLTTLLPLIMIRTHWILIVRQRKCNNTLICLRPINYCWPQSYYYR